MSAHPERPKYKWLSKSSLAVFGWDRHLCSARLRISIFWHSRVIPRLKYYVPLFGEWSRELRNFLLRSKNLLILRRVPQLDMGLAYSFVGDEEEECKRLLGRRRCTQKLFADHPHATMHDVAIFLKGVRLAELFCCHNLPSCVATELCRSGNTHPSTELLPCMQPPPYEWAYKSPHLGCERLGGNSMPPPTTQQDSKRDPSIPPPLRE